MSSAHQTRSRRRLGALRTALHGAVLNLTPSPLPAACGDAAESAAAGPAAGTPGLTAEQLAHFR